MSHSFSLYYMVESVFPCDKTKISNILIHSSFRHTLQTSSSIVKIEAKNEIVYKINV